MNARHDDRPGRPVTGRTWKNRLSSAFATRLETHRSHSLVWRLLVPLAFVLAGALFVTSAISSGGTDLRAGSTGDLDSLVNQQARDVQGLRDRAAGLTTQINGLSEGLGNKQVKKLQRQVDALRGPAGLDPVKGPGVTITLDDSPKSVQQSSDADADRLVVHQQDIQAVANALWAGGAEAMTIQGQRVVSTTGIKCVGNTVVLHGVPYAPPYNIAAIGNTDTMLESVNTSPYIGYYLRDVRDLELGWNVDVETELKMAGYDGPTELSYARPAGNTGNDTSNGS
jgi:uncharacterized protein YlxW (UPF0749 family)